jgi:hypothetical protein
MTTDDASAARSSRDPTRHPEVGLNIKYDVMCLDHQIHLLVNIQRCCIPSINVSCYLQIEESIKQELPILKQALEWVHEFVAMLKIKSIERRELLAIQKEQGVAQPLCPIMGTKNR